jgi:hypothetical protein
MVGGKSGETKVTSVTDRVCRKFPGQPRGKILIEISERAGAGTARVATGAAASARSWRTHRAFSRGGENTELRTQLFAFALWALGFVAAEHQRFELVLAFLADVFKDWHGSLQ